MSYNTGVINNAAPAATLMSTVQSLIAAHPAWEFVEQVVGSTATNVTDIYKCLGSLNSFGTDFYVGLHRSGATAGTAVFGAIIGEVYNAGAKTFTKGAPFCPGASAITVEADFSYGTDRHVANETWYATATNGFLKPAGSIVLAGAAPGAASTNFTYWLSVTNDRIVLACSHINNVRIYAGLYDSFHSTALDPFPLVTTLLYGLQMTTTQDARLDTAKNMGAFTRDAALAGSITGAFRSGVSGHGWTYDKASQANYWTDAGPATKETMSGKWWPTRKVLFPESRIGAVKGLFKADVLQFDLGEVTEAPGDTITIDGVTWVCVDEGQGVVTEYSQASSISSRKKSTWVSTAA